jgi:EAL domain-containing protein (putative c-di-GMP-specific phosphodiesterase class I)
MLEQLNRMGLKLAVDDFGTGYSSLSYLKRFPIDTLKIDQSFVRDVTTDADDASLVTAIIAMGHALQLNVIAEGVETPEQLDFLIRHGCDGMQGYLFSRPLPAEEITRLLQSGKKMNRQD